MTTALEQLGLALAQADPGELAEFLHTLEPDEAATVLAAVNEADVEQFIAGRKLEQVRAEVEADGPTWMRALFPQYAKAPFAPHMRILWAWVWSIDRGARPRPHVDIWARGASKSTTGEAAAISLGARGKRRYALYISGTQDQADKHVSTIGSMLESKRVAAVYPEMAERAVSQYGGSRGWSRQRLWTRQGFVIDALGLQASARGIRIEEDRPDLIILDDIDSREDGPAAVARKIDLLTSTILPAGSTDLAVMALQNVIHPNSIFARLAGLADEEADFLADRIVSGPIPAIRGLDVMVDDTGRHVVVGGEPTWEGYGLDAAQAAIDTYGYTSFLEECQHLIKARPGGMFSTLTYQRCKPDAVPPLIHRTCWVDPAVTANDGSDSQGIQIDGMDEKGVIYRLWSWEAKMGPLHALTRAIRMAMHFGSPVVGVETDQGGDTWESVYREAKEAVRTGKDGREPLAGPFPAFREEKAGSSHQSKAHRASQMLTDYEVGGRIVHVEGTHEVLEAALYRFPRSKPFDLCLAGGTLITTSEGDIPIQDVRVGDLVLTRDGFRPVRECGMTNPAAEILTVTTAAGRTLRGTANHPVWTEEAGWVPLGDLRHGVIVLACTNASDLTSSKPTASSTSGSPTTPASPSMMWPSSRGTCTSSTPGGTTTAPSAGTPLPGKPSTGRSGSPYTGPSQRGTTSTTRTSTRSTTIRRTSWHSPAQSTDSSTGLPSRWSTPGHTWSGLGRWRLSGTGARLAASGTGRMVSGRGFTARIGAWIARSAASLSGPATQARWRSAPRSAGTPSPHATQPITNPVIAPDAANRSGRGSTTSSGIAADRVRTASELASVGPVFNLSVEGTPEFFADGILVHNCDAAYWSWWYLHQRRGFQASVQVPMGTVTAPPINSRPAGGAPVGGFGGMRLPPVTRLR